MKTFIVFTLLASLFIHAKGQQNTYTTFYELDFPVNKPLQRWKSQSALVLSSDSALNTRNEVLRINRIYVKDTIPVNDISGALQQTLLLPSGKFNIAEISITSKVQNLEEARLKISLLDEREDIISTDTISMLQNTEWTTVIGHIPLQKAKLLFFSIEMKGSKKLCPQSLWLDKIVIKLDGKNIDTFPFSSLSSQYTCDKLNVIPLSFSDISSYNNISNLKDKQIIALGETVHGNKSINHVAFQFIRNQIINNDCTLVLLEFPIEQILSFNRYVFGDNTYSLEQLMADIESSLLSVEQIKEFIVWLKDYNKNAKVKVFLAGMDISSSLSRSVNSIFDYLYEMNKVEQNVAIDTLCLKLMNAIPCENVFTQLLPPYARVNNGMSENEYAVLKHCLDVTFSLGSNQHRRRQVRDSIMYENVVFLKNQLCLSDKKVVIYSHFEHVNSKSTVPSLGNFLKEVYHDKYFSIGILINEGDCIFRKPGYIKYLIEPLQSGISGSMEFALSKLNMSLIYLPIEHAPRQLIYMRNIGNMYLNDQFRILNLCDRLNGIVFINKDESSIEDISIEEKDEESLIMKNVEKKNDLKRKILEIKSRLVGMKD